MRHRSNRFHYMWFRLVNGAPLQITIQMEMSCPIKQFSPEHLECATKCRVKDHCAASGHRLEMMNEGVERKVF